MKVLAVLVVVGIALFVQFGGDIDLPDRPVRPEKKPTVELVTNEWAVVHPRNADGRNTCKLDMPSGPASLINQFGSVDQFFREYWWSTCEIEGYGTKHMGVHPTLRQSEEFRRFVIDFPYRWKPVRPNRHRYNMIVRVKPRDSSVYGLWLNGANMGPGVPYSTVGIMPRLQPNETVRLTILEPSMIHDLHFYSTPFRLGYPSGWYSPSELRNYPCKTADDHFVLALCVRLKSHAGSAPEPPYWRKFCDWRAAPIEWQGPHTAIAYLEGPALTCGNVLVLRNTLGEPAGIDLLFNSPLRELTYFTRSTEPVVESQGHLYGLRNQGVLILVEFLWQETPARR